VPQQDRENLTLDSVSYLSPAELHSNPAFTQAVRIPAGHDLMVIGGQNGVDSSGRVVSDDIAGQTRQALSNPQVRLEEAKTDLNHVVRWSIMIKRRSALAGRLCRVHGDLGQRSNPPALSVAIVSGFAVPGALCEIEALAAVPNT
jgi:enamine deaminase RidA (YjgF/YER057c/UK114 family)